MKLFLEHFGLLIFVAILVVWLLILLMRYPLQNENESVLKYLSRFCKKYEGLPCLQMKIVIWTCSLGTIFATLMNSFIRP